MPSTALQLQKKLPEVLNRITNGGNPEIIFNKNEPAAVILDYPTYNIFLSLFNELEEKGRYLDADREAKNKKGITLTALKKKYNLK